MYQITLRVARSGESQQVYHQLLDALRCLIYSTEPPVKHVAIRWLGNRLVEWTALTPEGELWLMMNTPAKGRVRRRSCSAG